MGVAVDVESLGGWIREFARAVSTNKELLTNLDSAIGDADHGANMDRGMAAVVASLDAAPPAGASALFKQVGMTLVSTVGGASGPLYGTLFLRMSTAAGSSEPLDGETFAKALRAGLEGVVSRGRAEAGDKTIFDALAPAVEALDGALASGASLADALRAAGVAAEAGRDATIPMVARKGRASYLGERSVGHQDPGATSAALLVLRPPRRSAARSRPVDHGRYRRGVSQPRARRSRGRPRRGDAARARAPDRGGCGAGRHDIGTDAVQILQAITAADSGDGVIVLMDLGSAVLSAELALDLLDDEARRRVVLSPAPLVEGLIVAAVATAAGATLEEVGGRGEGGPGG